MNWLIDGLYKEARRFNIDDEVRFFLEQRKGKGKGIVLTPSFGRGTVRRYDSENKKYVIWDKKNEKEVEVHPRNLVPGSISSRYDTSSGNGEATVESTPPMTDVNEIETLNPETISQPAA